MLILATMLQAKDYRTQEEKCREMRVDLIRNYHYFLESSFSNVDYYKLNAMEDLVERLSKYPKACEFSQAQQEVNMRNIGFMKGELKRAKRIK